MTKAESRNRLSKLQRQRRVLLRSQLAFIEDSPNEVSYTNDDYRQIGHSIDQVEDEIREIRERLGND